MRFSWCMCKAWLVVIVLIGSVSHEAFSQAVIANNPPVMSQSYVLNPEATGAGPHCFKIATLPMDNTGDDDHLHIVANLNYGWGAVANASIDALFGNRGGFTYSYTARGVPVSSTAKLVAYSNADTSVDIYLMFANVYATASYTVLETTEETVYPNPGDLLGATPLGTLVFDSSSPNYPPTTFSSFNGNVGIGTTSPLSLLQVGGTITGGTAVASPALITMDSTYGTNPVGTNFKFKLFQDNATNSYGLGVSSGLLEVVAGAGGGMGFFTNQTTEAMAISSAGNVGIGTTTPGADLSSLPSPPASGTPILEVSGDIALTQGGGGQVYYSDGTVQSTAWNGVLSGGDYAESVNVSGGRKEYEPGDVLVIDPASEGNFLKSSAPYSTAVTGIYSTKPGVVGRRQRTARAHMNEEVPMAMTGIVPTKVSAENGPIKPGDLLVTSSKPGYAMKGTDRTQMLGAVIGKAIGHLDSGVGVIEAVVTLQ